MKTLLLHVLLPLVVIALAALVAWWLIANRAVPPPVVPVTAPPAVAVVVATAADLRLVVASQGTAAPRTATTLSAEVAGRVVFIAPTLRNGGFFAAGDELVRIDPLEHEAALRTAEASLARAERELQWERAEAAAAVAEWRELHPGDAPALVRREPQLAEADALQRSAAANVAMARQSLDRTVVRAPYAGRVLRAAVDAGDFVGRGDMLARVHALDAVEVALPIADDELPFVDLPWAPGAATGPAVRLHAEFGGERREWRGRVVRTAGEIDPRTRMIHVLAEVADPYAGPSPLVVGMFVQAEIEGRVLPGAVVLPRAVLRGTDEVLVVDPDDTLRVRRVDVARRERDRIVLRGGVRAGERVCTTSLEAPTDGMRVRVVAGEAAR